MRRKAFLFFLSVTLCLQVPPLHCREGKGFEVGTGVGLFVGVSEFDTTLNGKMEVFAGRRFKSRIGLFLDLWTVNFIVGGVELNPQFRIIPGPISPFGTVGVGFCYINPSDEDLPPLAFTYHLGAGLDWRFKENRTLQFTFKYSGYHAGPAEMRVRPDSARTVGAFDFGIGYRWLF